MQVVRHSLPDALAGVLETCSSKPETVLLRGIHEDPVLGPENTRCQARTLLLTSGRDVGIGGWSVDIGVVGRQENKTGWKIVIGLRTAAAVVEAGIGGRAGRRVYAERNFMDHGIGIGLHLVCRCAGVTGAVGPRQAPHIVLTVHADLLTGQPVLHVAEVSVSPDRKS